MATAGNGCADPHQGKEELECGRRMIEQVQELLVLIGEFKVE